MRLYSLTLYAIFILLWSPYAFSLEKNNFLVLCYHDVRDNLTNTSKRQTLAMSTDGLIAQFNWLKGNGYTPVSLDDVIAANSGERNLPEKAVLLTFDDGYRGMYERVFPLLKLFNYPAVFGLVGKWLEDKENIFYSETEVPRDYFMSWNQIEEMTSSGLVEFASHSYDLHHGIVANPQGNLLPAAVARAYDSQTGKYEDDAKYRLRIQQDLEKNSSLLESKLHRKPRAIIWPYGEYNRTSQNIAEELGMTYNFILGDVETKPNDPQVLPRILVGQEMALSDFAWLVTYKRERLPKRTVHVDLDYIYDENPQQQERNLGQLLDRIKALKINTVYLQAYSDPEGTGVASSLYFPNRHMPMRADLFNRVAWQLRTRAGVKVYAWMPVMAFKLPPSNPLATTTVQSAITADANNYSRLSVFNDAVRQLIIDIYEDLAKYSIFAGILFHDDGFLSDYEDISDDAMNEYRRWGLPDDIDVIRRNPVFLTQWTQQKTQFLIDWTNVLAEHVRQFRPDTKTARNLYARVVLEPQAQQWFSQSLQSFVQAYDYTAIMAMPYMEEQKQPLQWLARLVDSVRQQVTNPDKVVFELQSRDWRDGKTLSGEEMTKQIQQLQVLGVNQYGYYPDDFIAHQPALKTIYPLMSLNRLPEFE